MMARHIIAVGWRLIALCSILACVADNSALAVSPAVPSGYGLKWSDEFNGNSLDLNIWSQQHPDDPTLNMGSVSDGTLKLTTYTDNNGVDHGGYITSGMSYERTYGYFVASIKFQPQSGTCGAYWMTAWNAYKSGGTTADGEEIDTIEHFRNPNGTSARLNNGLFAWGNGASAAHFQRRQYWDQRRKFSPLLPALDPHRVQLLRRQHAIVDGYEPDFAGQRVYATGLYPQRRLLARRQQACWGLRAAGLSQQCRDDRGLRPRLRICSRAGRACAVGHGVG